MRSTRRTTTAACVAVVFLAAGCGGGEPGGEGPATPTASETDTAKSPSEPTESASPSVEPASGPVIQHGVYSVRVPKGYETDGGGMTKFGYDPALPGLATFSEIANYEGKTLDDLVRASESADKWDRPPRRLPDLEIAGVPSYHLQGTLDGDPVDEFATVYEGHLARLRFDIRAEGAKRQQALASILASWEWK